MSDGQFAALLTVLGAGVTVIAAAIKFTGTRIIKAMDDSTAAVRENTASNAVLSTKIDHVSMFVRDREPTPVQGVPIVPQGGYSFKRPKTDPPDR